MTFFAIDETALLLAIPFCIFCFLLYCARKTWVLPEIFVSSLSKFGSREVKKNSLFPFFDSKHVPIKEQLQFLPYLLKMIAFAALLIAFLDMRLHFEHHTTVRNNQLPPQTKLATEGIAIYLVLDQSGSMAQSVTSRLADGQLVNMSKIDLLKQVTRAFIEGDPHYGLKGRPNDLIGLVEFARTAQVVIPLTLDRKALLEKLEALNVVPDATQDGTAIGYAILKTANLIAATRNYARDLIGQGKPAYEIKNFVIILVTDGLQDPNPIDKESKWRNIDPREVAQTIMDQGIRVYIVNAEPRLASEVYAANRRQMQQAAEMTGGKFFMVDSTTDLPEIYAAIDKLEKSRLPLDEEMAESLKKSVAKEKLPGIYDTFFLAPYLVALALLSLFLGIFLECTLLRKVP